MIATDNTSPAVSLLTVGVFTSLSSAPVLSGDCRTLYGVLTSNCLPLRLLRLNDQICLLAHDGAGNGFMHLSAPIRNK